MVFEKIEITVPMSLAEYEKRLTAGMSPSYPPIWDKKFVGRIKNDHLRVRRNILYGNAFQTLLYAKLSEGDGTTHLEGRFTFSRIAMAFMLPFATIMLISIVTVIFRVLRDGMSWFDAQWLLGSLLFPVAIISFGMYAARHERDEILCFIKNP